MPNTPFGERHEFFPQQEELDKQKIFDLAKEELEQCGKAVDERALKIIVRQTTDEESRGKRQIPKRGEIAKNVVSRYISTTEGTGLPNDDVTEEGWRVIKQQISRSTETDLKSNGKTNKTLDKNILEKAVDNVINSEKNTAILSSFDLLALKEIAELARIEYFKLAGQVQ